MAGADVIGGMLVRCVVAAAPALLLGMLISSAAAQPTIPARVLPLRQPAGDVTCPAPLDGPHLRVASDLNCLDTDTPGLRTVPLAPATTPRGPDLAA